MRKVIEMLREFEEMSEKSGSEGQEKFSHKWDIFLKRKLKTRTILQFQS